ncbi:MAG: hypothetical protein H7301_15430 [Cryobacterium sp.]|nr:hypothetical protein [Oligoflexia bacterium]
MSSPAQAQGFFYRVKSVCERFLFQGRASLPVSRKPLPDLYELAPHESVRAKNYRKNMERIGVQVGSKITDYRQQRAPHPSYTSELTLRLIGNFFETLPAGRELGRMLYSETSLSRASIREWSKSNANGFTPIWPEELNQLLKNPKSQLGHELLSLITETGQARLVDDIGWMPTEFYFFLISHGRFIVGNDHDIAMHLPLFAKTSKAKVAKKLADNYVRAYRLGRRGDALRVYSDLWEVTQEHQVFIDPNGGVAFIGGAYSLNPNLLIGTGRWLSADMTAWPALKSVFKRADIWKKLDSDPEWITLLRQIGPGNSDTESFIAGMTHETATLYRLVAFNDGPRDFEDFEYALDRYKDVLRDRRHEIPSIVNLNDQDTLDRLVSILLDHLD